MLMIGDVFVATVLSSKVARPLRSVPNTPAASATVSMSVSFVVVGNKPPNPANPSHAESDWGTHYQHVSNPISFYWEVLVFLDWTTHERSSLRQGRKQQAAECDVVVLAELVFLHAKTKSPPEPCMASHRHLR
jgi:hypothetical protein